MSIETKRDQRLRGEVKRLLRKAKKRGARELVKPVGAPPEPKLPHQIFEIIEALDSGTKAITNSAVVKTKDGGAEVIPGMVVRIGGREFHRKHFEIAKKFRKTRTELRLTEIQKKLGKTREEAIAYLREWGWKAS